MSSTSEETHDDMSQALDTPPVGSTPANVNEMASYQESSGAVSKPCSGSPSQQINGAVIRGKKRSLNELRDTDAPNTAEDEQHSSQSAFQQYHPHSKHSTAHQVCTLPHSSNQCALQALLSAAQRLEPTHQVSSSQPLQSEADGPSHLHVSSNPQLVRQRLPTFVAVRTDEPCQLDSMQGQPWPSHLTLQSPPPMPQHNMMGDASQLDAMYAPTKAKAKISPQLIRDLQRLEMPEMEADSVQAALEFAEAVLVMPAQHAQHAQQASDTMHPTFAQPHDTEPVRLLHAIEVGIRRLNVLRILTHRICNSTSSDFSIVTGSPEQLLEVIQDLLKDMQVSQQLLHHAEEAVIVHRKAAMQRVETLQAHHRDYKEYWLQSQRLQTISSERQAVLQRMLMLPLEPPSNDLLELFDKLQQSVICLLEVSACRAKLTGDMQLAQAQLVAQGVSGVTPKGMMTGQVELIVERPVRRLQTLLSIIRAITGNRNVLLLELASALIPWQQCSQHVQQHESKLAEAASQIQGCIEGLLKPDCKGQPQHQGQPPSHTSQQHFAKGTKSPFEGTAAAFGISSQPGKTADKSEQPSSLEAHRLQVGPSGTQSTAGGSPGSALPLTGRPSTQSNSTQLLSSCQDVSASSLLHKLQTSAQAGRQFQPKEYGVVKPRAQRPPGQRFESNRDPRAQPSTLHDAKARPGSAQSLPQQKKPLPPVTPEPAQLAHAAESRPETDAKACGLPDVRAAAEALLQAQLQELGVPSDQIQPQLLNLINALTGVSTGTSSTVSANVDPRGSPQEPIRATPHSGRTASEPVQEIAKVAKLHRHDSVRSQRGGAVGPECLHGGLLEGVPVTRGNVGDFGQKQSQHERQQHQQHEGRLQAAAYAQQLYALLAQAQFPQAASPHPMARARSLTPKPQSEQVMRQRLAQQ